MWPFSADKDKQSGNIKFKKFYVGCPLIKNADGITDKITEVVSVPERQGQQVFMLKNAGGPVTKPYIFKNYRLG